MFATVVHSSRHAFHGSLELAVGFSVAMTALGIVAVAGELLCRGARTLTRRVTGDTARLVINPPHDEGGINA